MTPQIQINSGSEGCDKTADRKNKADRLDTSAGTFDSITLGENEFFVLGDSRNSSVDSRLWGPVDLKDFQGTALVQYFPVNKFRFF